MAQLQPRHALRRPPRLLPGDRVAVVAPSGPVDQERLAIGTDLLRSWGLDVVPGSHLRDTHPELRYLAGTDADRAADFERAWLDPDIAAVICARGGYGVQRMTELVDWDALRAAPPKALVGFSDATALHEAVAQRLGVATLYGPMATTTSFIADAGTAGHLRRTLFDPADTTVLTAPTATPLVPGAAHGITAGGCASVLAADRGTPTARPSFAGALLLLEDTNEHPYQLDRILTQLLRSGALDGVAGIVLGSWNGCGRLERVRELMLDRLAPLGVPILWELGFGHGPSTLTVPLGIPARLDATAGTLTLDLPALSDGTHAEQTHADRSAADGTRPTGTRSAESAAS
ncbi:LD-carboxypeptidase [Kitasatospora kazusensis]|uniref:LD-carboxypeptidase n=1 Tax=Kitasatospora kazusensis TaxID=407974 RepID=A0ABP5LYZ8_9ACTN